MFHNDEMLSIAKMYNNLGIYAPNKRTPKYMKQNLQNWKKRQTIAGDFTSLLSKILDPTDRQLVETEAENHTVKQMISIKFSSQQ